MGNITLLIIISYLVGICIFCMIQILIGYNKYDDIQYLFLYLIIPFELLFKCINNCYKKFKTKQIKMNLRILGKAMSFIFLPTLGVLLMLLIGFFDPIAMWTFIKSDSGWAITLRLIIFIAEIILIALMYCHYYEQETKADALKGEPTDEGKKINYSESLFRVFNNPKDDDHYTFHKHETKSENMVLVERRPK